MVKGDVCVPGPAGAGRGGGWGEEWLNLLPRCPPPGGVMLVQLLASTGLLVSATMTASLKLFVDPNSIRLLLV